MADLLVPAPAEAQSSGRGTIDGLASPFPLGQMLPSVYQEDSFVQRFTAGLDVVLAPVIWVLDSFPAYLDPDVAPIDFVAWLATWVGVELDETWPDEAKRELVHRAVELFRIRGTLEGLAKHVAIYTRGEVQIEESGGCRSSMEPNSDLPGDEVPWLVVRIFTEDPGSVDLARVDRIVSASKPAHVPHRVELSIPSARTDRTPSGDGSSPADDGAQAGEAGVGAQGPESSPS